MKPILLSLLLFTAIPAFSQRLVSATPYGTTGDEEAVKMIHTKDNGYLLVGTHYPGSSRYFVKLDSGFNKVWVSNKPSFKYSLSDIIETLDSGFMVCGAIYDSNATYPFIQKLDKNCDTLWSKKYKQWIANYTYFDEIIQLTDASYVVRFYANPNHKDLAGIDINGNIKWNINLTPETMLAIKDSFVISTNGTYFRKLTNGGKLVLDTNLKLNHHIDNIIALKEGGYGLCGNGLGITKVTASGDTVWSKRYPESAAVGSVDVKETLDSGFLALGNIYDDVYLLKTDKNGSKEWSYEILRLFETETGNSLALDCDSSIHIFEYATNGKIGGEDLYILKMDSMKNVYGPCARITDIAEMTWNKSIIKLFPNPAHDYITANPTLAFPATISMYNSVGDRVKSFAVSSLAFFTIPLQELPAGIYFLEIQTKTAHMMEKFMKY